MVFSKAQSTSHSRQEPTTSPRLSFRPERVRSEGTRKVLVDDVQGMVSALGYQPSSVVLLMIGVTCVLVLPSGGNG
jgi:hypothetical protein